jgi:hypothetical protein
VPGLPGLGSAKSTRGAALVSEVSGASRRPLAPLPPPPVVPGVGNGLGASPPSASAASVAASSDGASRAGAPNGAASAGSPAAPRSVSGSTQLGDQFRESVQAGAIDELPREGWFVGVNGVPLGPIPLGDLRELAIAGHIDRRSLVWREGQPEWRPLGKFPGLARVIDDGSGPPSTPLPEPAAATPSSQLPPPPSLPPPSPPARLNGAGSNGGNTHVATGFDAPRPDLSERPSAWGDLDDEDDDDEQPTTVKGRVSVMPSSNAMPISMVPPPSVPQVLPQAAPPPAPPAARGNTTSVPVFQPMAPAPAPAPGPSPAVFSGMVDVEPPPSRARTRWYLIAAAIVFAFALGAVVTHLMRSSAAEKPAPTGGAPRSSLVSSPSVPAGTLRGGGLDAAQRGGPSRSPPPVLTSRAVPVDPTAASAFETDLSPPSAPPSRAALLSAGSEGRMARRMSGTDTSARGLNAKTVQRTVRRYSPAVRQSCWHRALGARAPGVPASAKVTASITVESTGRVQAVSVSGAPRGYPGLARCIEGIVRGWRFPRASARTITSVPFMFLGR